MLLKKNRVRIPALIIVIILLLLFLQHQNVFSRGMSFFSHQVAEVPLPPAGSAAQKKQSFSEHIHSESERIAETEDDPEYILQQETNMANNLQPSDMEVLKAKALDEKASGDERSFAIQLLGINGSPAAIARLEEIALSLPPDLQDIRRNLRESMVRAQAIESMKHKEALLDVLKKTKDAFLVERTHKALQHLDASASLEQDKKALTK